MSELRIGIVGLGWVAGAHIETFKHVTGARVTAVCSRRRHDPAALEARYGLPLKAYTDWRICWRIRTSTSSTSARPTRCMPEQAIAAARAGKHLVIEKPIALTWKDAKAVGDAIARRRRPGDGLLRAAVQRAVHAGEVGGRPGTARRAPSTREVDYFHGIGPWYGQFAWNVKKTSAAPAC